MKAQEIFKKLPKLPFAVGLGTDDETAQIISQEGLHVCNVEIYPVKETTFAILSAVNNTYGKGVNPESVGEMLEALQWIAHHAMQEGCDKKSLQAVAKQAIEKATLTQTVKS